MSIFSPKHGKYLASCPQFLTYLNALFMLFFANLFENIESLNMPTLNNIFLELQLNVFFFSLPDT